MSSKILKCDCVHQAQDQLYGLGLRVHTFGRKKEVWRCTVCLKEKEGKKDG